MTQLETLVVSAKVIDTAIGYLSDAEKSDKDAGKASAKLAAAIEAGKVFRHLAYSALGAEIDRLVKGGMAALAARDAVSAAAIARASKSLHGALAPKTIAQYAASAQWVIDRGFVTVIGDKVVCADYVPTSSEAKLLKAQDGALVHDAGAAGLSVPGFVARTVKGHGEGTARVAPMSATKLAASLKPAPVPTVPTPGDTLSIDTPSTMPNTLGEAIGRQTVLAAQYADLVPMLLAGTYSEDEATAALAAARVMRAHAASVITKLAPAKPAKPASTQAA